MRTVVFCLAVLLYTHTLLASSLQCVDLFHKNTDTQSILDKSYDSDGIQKIIHIVPNFLKNFERILSQLKHRKNTQAASGLSIVILPSHSKIEDKKLSVITSLLPKNISTYFVVGQIERDNFTAFLQSSNGVVFVEANLIGPFLQKILDSSFQNSQIRFDGVYLDEKPELDIFLSRALLDQFLLQTDAILYGVSSGPALQQRARVTHYQNVLIEGQTLLTPEESMNLSYSFAPAKKPPRHHLKILSWDDFKTLVASKKFRTRKEYIYWVETEKPQGVTLYPHISYANEWKGWEHLLGSKWMSFQEAKQVAIAAGLKNQSDFLNWGRRPPGFPSYPKSVYPEFTTWADFLGTELRTSPRLIEILPFEEARRVASAWARANNIKTIAAYRARKDKPKGLPHDPGTAYKEKGWTNAEDFLGVEPKSTMTPK